ncbi:MAG: hypothetical protein KDD82_03990 [Planctomycetes bacterium]|nr:hypothetical protein [Planctomycetota bacterium]
MSGFGCVSCKHKQLNACSNQPPDKGIRKCLTKIVDVPDLYDQSGSGRRLLQEFS